MSVSILLPVLFSSDDESEVLFVDFSSMSVYTRDGKPASEDKSEAVLQEISDQQESSIPYIPRDQIIEIMNTERSLSSDNAHIFRGNQWQNP
jgi:hypothetical protein